MELSIVLVNYRSADKLVRCLDSMGLPRPGWQVIVVDHSPDPAPLEALRDRIAFELLHRPKNPGFAAGCNCGLARAQAPVVLFLNPDTVDPGGQIESLLARWHSRPPSILAPQQVDTSGHPQRVAGVFPSVATLLIGRWLRRRQLRGGPVLAVDWLSGSALMMATAQCRAIGGWSEDFWMFSEDVDLCRRAAEAGVPRLLDTKLQMEHAHGGSTRVDVETAARTRAEALISRHVYASRHLGWLHAALYHALVAVLRAGPMLLAAALTALWPGAPARLRVRAHASRRVLRHYLLVLRTRDWRSPAAPNRQRAMVESIR